MTPTEKIALAIDLATDAHRTKLTAWELKFLTSLAQTYRKSGALSPRQKQVALPILKRVGAMATAYPDTLAP